MKFLGVVVACWVMAHDLDIIGSSQFMSIAGKVHFISTYIFSWQSPFNASKSLKNNWTCYLTLLFDTECPIFTLGMEQSLFHDTFIVRSRYIGRFVHFLDQGSLVSVQARYECSEQRELPDSPALISRNIFIKPDVKNVILVAPEERVFKRAR